MRGTSSATDQNELAERHDNDEIIRRRKSEENEYGMRYGVAIRSFKSLAQSDTQSSCLRVA